MSGSDSDHGSHGSWALVDAETDSSGSDFVNVQSEDAVVYHHKEKKTGSELDAVDKDVQEHNDIEDEENNAFMVDWDCDWYWDDSCVGEVVNGSEELPEDQQEAGLEKSVSEISLDETTEKSAVEDLPLSVKDAGNDVPSEKENDESLHNLDVMFNEEKQRIDTSDSEHSDFVKLDATMAEEFESPAVMKLSMSSVASSHSSVSSPASRFRFHHVMNPVELQQMRRTKFYRDNDSVGVADDDVDSLPSDVDDRCESDISGVATDDDEDSAVVSHLGEDVLLTAGDVPRSYRHRPNPSLNAVLTTLTLVALAAAIAGGVGNYLGHHNELGLRTRQEVKMKELQDDFLTCLNQRNSLKQELAAPLPDSKLNAVTEVWKKKYQEMIVERVDLEQNITDLQLKLEQSNEALNLQQQELASLKVEHSTSLVQAEEYVQRDAVMQDRVKVQANEIATKEAEVKSKDDELASKDEELQTVKQELNDRKDLLMDKDQEITTLKEQLESIQQEIKVAATSEPDTDLVIEQSGEMKEVDVTSLKADLNHLRNENEELKLQVSKLRYQPLPESPKEILDDNVPAPVKQQMLAESEMKDKVNELENSEISMSESTDQQTSLDKEVDVKVVDDDTNNTHTANNSSPDEAVSALRDRVTALDAALSNEKLRSEMWLSLYIAEKERHSANVPSFLTCVTFLLPNVNVSHYSSNASDLDRQWQFVRKLLDDTKFMDNLQNQWSKFNKYSNPEGMSSKAKAAYRDMEKAVLKKWDDFVKIAKNQEIPEKIKTAIKNENLQILFNKTKETVFELTDKIHSTWHKVKNLSSNVIENNEAVSKFTSKIRTIGSNFQTGWQQVKNKVENGWFQKKTSGEKKSKKTVKVQEHPQDHLRNSAYGGYYKATEDKGSQQTIPKQDFENKPHHKQKRSSTLEEEYDEFWQKEGYDPDDFIYEDFFEGKGHERKKQQKRFKRIHGRISQLNEDILYSMDDDDIEDIYDELDDFEDDLEDDDKPVKLKNWLTCQTLWWKSRFQRKHRSEDFVKGCGAQLMRWQLRALCKPKCRAKDKKCRRRISSQAESSKHACQLLKNTVIQRAQRTPKDNCKVQKTVDLVDSFVPKKDLKNESSVHTDVNGNDETSWYFSRKPEGVRSAATIVEPESGHTAASDTKIVYVANQRSKHHSQKRSRSQWMFDRATERENHHQKPDWVFKRANNREFEREKPWYFKRADGRSDWKNNNVKVHHHHHRHHGK